MNIISEGLQFASIIGAGGLVSNVAKAVAPKGGSILMKGCYLIGTTALGMAVADVAAKQVSEAFDYVIDIYEGMTNLTKDVKE